VRNQVLISSQFIADDQHNRGGIVSSTIEVPFCSVRQGDCLADDWYSYPDYKGTLRAANAASEG
jgi:hypothetical protein